ncbi:hypothetical protein QBC38DRAFT_132111 [Podospora fimiseda]|uniref:Uncharacterized protein n=1 Tax=Podospora fimiseda TaxID=252190 RepID=A0AAN7H1W2_9PEZI|nr:hypothetical protein QBC38DRAFT_132111 [Podospora fimiseda]
MTRQKYDDSANTRWWSVFGLVISWFVAMGALFAGAICLYLEIRDGKAPHLFLSNTWREVLPLGLNIFVTLLNDTMGYTHAVALRWSLQREGKLDFNSNLRLLTASKYSVPNGLAPNLTYLAGIVLAYGSTSLIFLSFNPQLAQALKKLNPETDSDDINGVHVNGVALLTFGFGFFLQAILTNWALVRTEIPTWSSNPLDVARACMVDDSLDGYRVKQRQGRCMMGVHLAEDDAKPLKPVPKQRRMISAHPHVRRVLYLLWILPVLAGIWGGGVYGYLIRGSRNGIFGRSWSLLPVFTGETNQDCITKQCTDGTSILNMGWSASGTAGTVGGVFLIIALQAVVTLSLHCCELIVNLSRDEKIWRKLIGPRGTNGHYNSVWAAFTSWQTVFLFTMKAGVHWMFGMAINLQYNLGVNMHPPQIFYFAGICLIAALFGLFLSLQQPKGHLPPSFGHIRTIADIIDEWADSGCMFWGEKIAPKDGESGFTGTSTERLKMPDVNKYYGGQKEWDAATISEIPLDVVSPIEPPSAGGFGLHPSPPQFSPIQQPNFQVPMQQGYFAPMAQQARFPAPGPHGHHQHPPAQQGQYTFSQWTQQGHPHAHSHPSQSSLNSRYSGSSGYSGYSAHSDQSAQPFLGGYRI